MWVWTEHHGYKKTSAVTVYFINLFFGERSQFLTDEARTIIIIFF